jgi:hypothetical protein
MNKFSPLRYIYSTITNVVESKSESESAAVLVAKFHMFAF